LGAIGILNIERTRERVSIITISVLALAARIGKSSSTCSNTYLGLPDAGCINLSDMEALLQRTVPVTPIPVTVDVDDGYNTSIRVRLESGAIGLKEELLFA
jgi:hypothetical protein